MAETVETHPPSQSALSAFLRSKPLWIAFLATVLSAAWWIYRDVSAPPAAPTSESGAKSGLVAGVTAGSPTAPAERPASPVTFRMGISFMAGFAVMWLFRKFLKVTLIVGGTVVAIIAVLKATGLISLDWSQVEADMQGGIDAASKQATAFKDFVVAALPSGASAAVGGFFGFRRS
ncbi:MAG: FUN14 domain-containing protein [Phycisphaerae bacterium]|nr:FUN14 domain-containing protein [Phycisphaerae bacterium]